MPESRGVVVTGMGAVSALGVTVEENWRAARDGHCGIKASTLDPGPNGPGPHTLPLALIDPAHKPGMTAALRQRGAVLDPVALYAVTAAREALGDAGLAGHAGLAGRSAVIFGQGYSSAQTLERGYERFYGRRMTRLHPFTIPAAMVSSAVSAIAMEFAIKGPAFAVSSACSSSGHAIVQGALLIQAGLADMVVVGGGEALVSPATMRAWEASQVLSPNACRPFSAGRDGMVIGEGAAALVLESAAHAAARNAKIHGELSGFGMSSDAFHWTRPAPEGAIAALRQACEMADVMDAAELLISAHGNGTVLSDANEAQALRAVFGARIDAHSVIATKSAHGHLIGGSMALQAIIGLKALAARVAPPVLNWLGADPDCALNLVLDKARPIAGTQLLVNACGFGGLNVALVFTQWPQPMA